MNKWIWFDEISKELTHKKTKEFSVRTKEGDVYLGTIKWYGAWRQYAFFPSSDTIYTKTCLMDIANFMNELMLKWKIAKRHQKNISDMRCPKCNFKATHKRKRIKDYRCPNCLHIWKKNEAII